MIGVTVILIFVMWFSYGKKNYLGILYDYEATVAPAEGEGEV